MSERERWIVYPLLLMTLGIVLRDKLVGATNLQAQRVTCGQLVVVDDKGREVAAIDGTRSQPLLGNFRQSDSRQLPDWMRTWPLLDPRLHHQTESPVEPQNSDADGQQEPLTK